MLSLFEINWRSFIWNKPKQRVACPRTPIHLPMSLTFDLQNQYGLIILSSWAMCVSSLIKIVQQFDLQSVHSVINKLILISKGIFFSIRLHVYDKFSSSHRKLSVITHWPAYWHSPLSYHWTRCLRTGRPHVYGNLWYKLESPRLLLYYTLTCILA